MTLPEVCHDTVLVAGIFIGMCTGLVRILLDVVGICHVVLGSVAEFRDNLLPAVMLMRPGYWG